MNQDRLYLDVVVTTRGDSFDLQYPRQQLTNQGRCPRVRTPAANFLFPTLADGRGDVG